MVCYYLFINFRPYGVNQAAKGVTGATDKERARNRECLINTKYARKLEEIDLKSWRRLWLCTNGVMLEINGKKTEEKIKSFRFDDGQ